MSEIAPQAVKDPQLVIGDEEIFDAHAAGKLSVALTAALDTQRALSIAYTPGVAQVSRSIAADHTLAARIVPSPLDPRVGKSVAAAVAAAADTAG